jgi:hypothetical protein
VPDQNAEVFFEQKFDPELLRKKPESLLCLPDSEVGLDDHYMGKKHEKSFPARSAEVKSFELFSTKKGSILEPSYVEQKIKEWENLLESAKEKIPEKICF